MLPSCAVGMPGLQSLTWWPSEYDWPSIHLATLATCRAAYVHPARVADLVLEVFVDMDGVHSDVFYSDSEEDCDEFLNGRQGMRDEWQAEQARLQAIMQGVAGYICTFT